MRNKMLAACAALATLVAVSPANAATYTIDSDLSSITLFDLNAGGFAFAGQGGNPANLVAFYGGTVDATVSGGPATPTITFGPSSFADALLNPNAPGGEYSPAQGGAVPGASNSALAGGDYVFADGSPDPAGEGDGVFSVGEDNYGVQGTGVTAGIVTSVRNFAVGFGGSGVANDAAADAHILSIVDGWYAINLAGFGTAFMAEEQTEVYAAEELGANNAGDLGYSLVGDIETITIPFNVSFQAFDTLNAKATGTIVASRQVVVIPEPTSGLFLATLVAGAGAVVRRRRK